MTLIIMHNGPMLHTFWGYCWPLLNFQKENNLNNSTLETESYLSMWEMYECIKSYQKLVMFQQHYGLCHPSVNYMMVQRRSCHDKDDRAMNILFVSQKVNSTKVHGKQVK